MNVYDFDQTVFQPDSSYCFVMYCLRHYPRAVLHCLPGVSYTGKIHGLNCHDEEKVRRFRLEVPEGHIENFYSDSLSDSPLAKLADRAWLVKKGKLSPWPEE